jgi:hypothetical protein
MESRLHEPALPHMQGTIAKQESLTHDELEPLPAVIREEVLFFDQHGAYRVSIVEDVDALVKETKGPDRSIASRARESVVCRVCIRSAGIVADFRQSQRTGRISVFVPVTALATCDRRNR